MNQPPSSGTNHTLSTRSGGRLATLSGHRPDAVRGAKLARRGGVSPMYAGVALRITSPQPIAARPASATRAAAARAPIGDFLHWRKSRLEGAILLADGRCYRSCR